MPGFGGAVKLTGESEYRKALAQITQNLKEVSSEMKATTSAFGAGDKSVEATKAKTEALTKVLTEQNNKLNTLKAQYESFGAKVAQQAAEHEKLLTAYNSEKTKLEEIGRTLGTTSKEYQEQRSTVENLAAEVDKSTKAQESNEKAMSKMRVEINNAQADCNKTSQELKKLSAETEDAGKKADKAGVDWTKFNTIIKNVGVAVGATVAAMGAAAVGAGKKLFDMATQVSSAGDEIDKASQKLGVSSDNYQKLAYAMEMSGSNIDDISKGVKKITSDLADAENGVAGAGKSFEELGVSLRNTDGSFKTSEQVLLDSIEALSRMENQTQRNALAQDIFGKGAAELNPLLNAGADGIKELMQEAEAYGMVMSAEAVSASANFDDSLTRLTGTLNGVKNSMLGALLPSIGQIVDGFSNLVIGNKEATKQIEDGVNTFVANITDMVPRAVGILKVIAEAVLKSAPQIITALAKGLIDTIPELAPVALGIIVQITGDLIRSLPQIVDAGVKMLFAIIEGIKKSIPQLAAMLPTIITTIKNTLLSFLQTIMQVGAQLLSSLISGLASGIGSLAQKARDLGNTILGQLKSFPASMLEAGKNLVRGLWNGISNSLSWIKDKIKGWVGNVTSFIKRLFGISSPSKLFRDEIGENLALGIGEGFTREMRNVSAMMGEAIPKSFDVETGITGVSGARMGEGSQGDLAAAFMEALSLMKIELDDEVAGRFVVRTVTREIYA